MRAHRASYLKTVVAALGGSVASLALVAFWLAEGQVRIPLAGWMLVESRLLLGASSAGLVALGLVCLLAALGGLFALYEDANEGRGRYAGPRQTRDPMVRANGLRAFHGRRLRAGDYVEVRSAREIEATLDDRGCLGGLPFMPEMAPYCGTVHRVFKRIDKIIDIVEHTGLRRMSGTVTLENLRCDGRAHGGCQAGCQFLWKEDWLRRCSAPRAGGAGPAEPIPGDPVSLKAGTVAQAEKVFRCQATELFRASSYLHPWDPRQYLSPLWSGNVTPVEFLRGISIDFFNAVQHFRRGPEFPYWVGSRLEKTPTSSLGLRPGEWVRIKIKKEILETVDRRNRNRGLWFGREMLRYCGGRFRVLRRVDRLIEEKSGRLVQLETPSVILDGVTANGDFYRFNPQNDYIIWREIWLERVETGQRERHESA